MKWKDFNGDGKIDATERFLWDELMCTSKEEHEALFGDAGDFEEDDDDDKTVWLMIGGFAIGTVLGIAFEKYILGLAFAIVGQGLGLILKAFDKKS